jgi:type II secretory pathway predicted ATPase ExeA
MYRAYWGMEFNPFSNEIKEKQLFHGKDYEETIKRLEYLRTIRGIGLLTGASGTGKTCTLRAFTSDLNSTLYKAVYLSMTTITINDFYKDLATGLGLEPSFRKIDNFRLIQERIQMMYKDQRITLLLIIDEAQYLHKGILTDLKLLMNFQMDSQNYAILVLCGQPHLNNILSMGIHEALRQRIVINYNYQGLQPQEVKEYVKNRMEQCGVKTSIFADSALEALHGCCGGSIRKLNTLVLKALMIGCEKEEKEIDTETIMDAVSEMELM